MKILIDIPEKDYEYVKQLPKMGIGSDCLIDTIYEAIRTGRVIPTDICSCWEEYPNKNHKFKNGKWKCVDCYTNINGAEGYKRKTHCRRTKTDERNIIPGNDTSEPEDKKE